MLSANIVLSFGSFSCEIFSKNICGKLEYALDTAFERDAVGLDVRDVYGKLHEIDYSVQRLNPSIGYCLKGHNINCHFMLHCIIWKV